MTALEDILAVDDKPESARRYALRGWAVVPLHELVDGECSCNNPPKECSPGKHPRSGPGLVHGLSDATTDLAVIDTWWTRWPTANIGIACGPSRLVVVDVDSYKDEAVDSLVEFMAAGYRLPKTLSQITGSGGAQYVYQAPTWTLKNHTGQLDGVPFPLLGIDQRGVGGYFVAPPSRTDRNYWWLEAWPQEPAPCPPWLRPPPPRPARANTHRRTSANPSSRLEALAEKVADATEGERNHILNWAAYTGRELNDPDRVTEALTAAAHQAGLGETETRLTIASGLGLKRRPA